MDNQTFLQAIFGNNMPFAHVTDFTYDPANIPNKQILLSWLGDYNQRYKFSPYASNQYFTISVFNPDEQGRARRRKSLFLYTPVIVLDDVKEKLSLEEVKKLPKPSYIMETSPGSEQWGYILREPCTDRHTVENLLDGLVSNGLAPDGKDPGMKGVTRYVRLPGGYNTKASKMVNGQPFKCRITYWQPQQQTTVQELAEPFAINLHFKRNDGGINKPIEIPDHPIHSVNIQVKKKLAPGRYDITCPWVDQHTDRADNGTAMFTNEDGSIGFKCHHGHCEDYSAGDLVKKIEETEPNFNTRYKIWQFQFLDRQGGTNDITPRTQVVENFSFLGDESTNQSNEKKEETSDNGLDQILQTIITKPPNEQNTWTSIENFLKMLSDENPITQNYYHSELRDYLGMGKTEFSNMLKKYQKGWYKKDGAPDFFSSMVYIRDQDRIYDYDTGIFYTADGFQRSFGDREKEAKKLALSDGLMQKADKMDFAPKKPKIFKEGKIMYTNGWNPQEAVTGKPGDCTPWLRHWDVLGWSEHRDHMLKFMAFTLLHPEQKINHIILLGGGEGVGKDFILKPFIQAMGDYSRTIQGHELLSSFEDYLFNTKHLHINEIELGDHSKSGEVATKLKPLATAPPDRLRVNKKFANPVSIQNIVNLTMTSNSKLPIRFNNISRRFYAVWTDLDIRGDDMNIKQEWVKYWNDLWNWMRNGGIEHCIYYLRNNVDLTDFNPGATPKITDFMREISDSSKSPAQQTLEAFINNKIGSFKKDLVTPDEMLQTIKAGVMSYQNHIFTDVKWFTAIKIGRVLSDVKDCKKFRARGQKDLTVWCIRNLQKYNQMSQGDLYQEYYKQV